MGRSWESALGENKWEAASPAFCCPWKQWATCRLTQSLQLYGGWLLPSCSPAILFTAHWPHDLYNINNAQWDPDPKQHRVGSKANADSANKPPKHLADYLHGGKALKAWHQTHLHPHTTCVYLLTPLKWPLQESTTRCVNINRICKSPGEIFYPRRVFWSWALQIDSSAGIAPIIQLLLCHPWEPQTHLLQISLLTQNTFPPLLPMALSQTQTMDRSIVFLSLQKQHASSQDTSPVHHHSNKIRPSVENKGQGEKIWKRALQVRDGCFSLGCWQVAQTEKSLQEWYSSVPLLGQREATQELQLTSIFRTKSKGWGHGTGID